MKFKCLYIFIIALILSKSNVYAFSFGEFESGITIDKAISLTKQSKGKLIELENMPESTIAVEYILDGEKHYLVLEFTSQSKLLYSLTVHDTETKDIKKLERNFIKYKDNLETIYGVPSIERQTVAIIGIPKTVSDNPNTYIYENNEDKVDLIYSAKLQILSLRYTCKLLKNIE
jgi:hypothetical protein